MTVRRVFEWYVLRPVLIAIIHLSDNWRGWLAIIGGAMAFTGMWGLVTADVELYIDYAVALRHMAICWLLVISGGLIASPWIERELGE